MIYGDVRHKPRGVFKRYHVETKETPPKTKLPPKYLVKRYNNCTYVQECTVSCIYGVHVLREDGTVDEPRSELCRGCHVCSLACPKAALSVELNPEFLSLGNSYFTPERIERIYFEAETGRVPVSGAGYGGPFAGRGFDSMWFDFSEIVRPTRDGIHGREYISTSVDLGRKLPYLQFDENGKLAVAVPPNIEIPIPMLLDAPTPCAAGKWLQPSLAKAASILETFSTVRAEDFWEGLTPYGEWIIPRVKAHLIDQYANILERARIVEIDCEGNEDFRGVIEAAKSVNPSTLVSLRLPYSDEAGEIAVELVDAGTDIAHFYAEDKDVEKNPEHITRSIRSVHASLVEKGVRDQITFISSGGIAEAAHVPKSIQLGADAVSQAIKKLGRYDLILCGVETTDGNTGQVGPEVAERLGIPQITYVEHFELRNGYVKAKRLIEGGCAIVKAKIPALLTITNTSYEPREATVGGVFRAVKSRVHIWSAKDVGIDPAKVGLKGSPTKMKKIERVAVRRARYLIKDGAPDEMVDALLKKLQEDGVKLW